jgi:hypothetical protein
LQKRDDNITFQKVANFSAENRKNAVNNIGPLKTVAAVPTLSLASRPRKPYDQANHHGASPNRKNA